MQNVGTTIEQLNAIQPNLLVERQREAVCVWQPLYDRVAALFAETVEGPLPTLQPEAEGKYRVEGGWPCQHYPDGWAARACAALADYRRLRTEHRLCKGPERAEGRFRDSPRLPGALRV